MSRLVKSETPNIMRWPEYKEVAATSRLNFLCSYSSCYENLTAMDRHLHIEDGPRNHPSVNLKRFHPLQYWKSKSYCRFDYISLCCSFSSVADSSSQGTSLIRSLESRERDN
jgi:hypothetical protein